MKSLIKAFLICLIVFSVTNKGLTAIDIGVDVPELVQQLAGLKVEGKGYFYYYHDATDGDGQSNSFDLSRLYMGAKYRISDEFSVRYLTDVSHQASDADHKENYGKFEVFTKYAYMDWNISENNNMVMGLQGTNNWKPVDKAWGYRSLGKAPMEAFGSFWSGQSKAYQKYLEGWAEGLISTDEKTRLNLQAANIKAAGSSKMGSSADIGVGVKLKPTDVTYLNLLIRNGTGYKKVENDMFKNIQLRGGVYLMDRAVHLTGYFELEPWRGINAESNTKGYMNNQWDLMASYMQKGAFTVGVNINSKSFDGIQTIDAFSASVFGNAYIIPKRLKALVRYDNYITGFNDVEVKQGDDNLKSNGSLLIVGLDYKVHKKVSIVPNFQMTSFEDSKLDPIRSVYVHMTFKL